MRTLHRAAVGTVLLLTAYTAGAEQPYWVCRDDSGRRAIQDRPCADAPNAPPTGVATGVPAVSAVPVGESPATHGSGTGAPTRDTDSTDSMEWWAQRWQRLRDRWLNLEMVTALLNNRLVQIGFGVLVLLWLTIWAWRTWVPRWRQRQVEREASAQPDPYRKALRDIVVTPSAVAPRAAAMVVDPETPTRWSPQVLRSLSDARFQSFALRLWGLRGLRAEGGEGGAPLMLRHPSNPQALHGVVLCRRESGVPLGAAVVRELYGLMQHHGCGYGAVLTAGDFNPEARDFARGKNMELKGWATLMTEVEALSDEQRASLLAEVLRKSASA